MICMVVYEPHHVWRAEKEKLILSFHHDSPGHPHPPVCGGVSSEIGFLCVAFGACPVTLSVDQASLELTEICLPLPPDCWD